VGTSRAGRGMCRASVSTVHAQFLLTRTGPAVSSDVEMCEARAAEYRRKALEATEPFIKEKFLEIAQEWQELSVLFRTTAAVESMPENPMRAD